MSSAAADVEASSACWRDLPFDLLCEISRRLHSATNYVRFHAVCKSWRDTLPLPPGRPTFLPWLLARRDDTGHRNARCVFSKSSRCATANGLYVRDRGWAIAADDGAPACCLFTASTSPDDESNGIPDPITGFASSITLPPYTDEMKSWVTHASGMVSGDGTLFLYAFSRVQRTIFVALLRPGDAAWTAERRNDMYPDNYRIDTCSIAYHDGKIIVQCYGSWTIVSTKVGGGRRSGYISAAVKKSESSYFVESRGELLWVAVHVNSDYYWDTMVAGRPGDLSSLQKALGVSIYALRYEGGEPQWVIRDCRSFVDRILFLGRQGSFAVDAAPFGVGGCAYFVDRRTLYSGAWSKSPQRRSRVYKYIFMDDRSEFVEQLPTQWNDATCMWLTPKPAIASTEEIEEKLKPSLQMGTRNTSSGYYFTIYVSNLPRKVDSYRLRQFFSKHGKVTDARVMVDRKTRRSRGFGYVTMENTAADDEPAAHAVAKFQGQCLDGRPLLVQIADQ